SSGRLSNLATTPSATVIEGSILVDLWAAIDAAKTKPFGFAAFYPGPGVGGHCIPIDPNYLSHQVRALGYQFRFVELAQEISGRMPAYVVSRIQDLLNSREKAVKGSRVLLLGLTYKPDISDDRETPARDVVRHLRRLGATVIGCDPHVTSFEVDGEAVRMAEFGRPSLQACDVAVLLQPHRAFDLDLIADAAPAVFDTRGRMSGSNVEVL
ncbi:MAG: UDP binding domain-containing protein, partial [Actinomycetota bacterium]